MNRYIKTLFGGIAIIASSLTLLINGSCSKMDSTYKDFIKDGSVMYTGAPDSIYVMSGNERLNLRLFLSDRTAYKAKVYWNNRSDSATFDLHQQTKEDLAFEHLTEGSYSFDIYLYDDKGNSSVQTTAVGIVYGKDYINGLLPRSIRNTIYQNNATTISWGTSDPTIVGAQIRYITNAGLEKEVYSPSDKTSIILSDFDFENHATFSYSTAYRPDTLAIDTFYTAYTEIVAQRPPTEYDRTTWTAPAEDYDTGNSRPPQNVLDGNTGTVWHMDKNHGYPHQITVDMKQELEVHGFTYNQRTPLDGAAKLVEIFVSHDNINWQSLGPYTFENAEGKQYLDLLEPATFRYFRMIFKSDYKSGTFTAIAEIGAYYR